MLLTLTFRHPNADGEALGNAAAKSMLVTSIVCLELGLGLGLGLGLVRGEEHAGKVDVPSDGQDLGLGLCQAMGKT